MHRVNHFKFLQPLLSNRKRPVFFVVVFAGFFHLALKNLTDTDKYPCSGHSALMGKVPRNFRDTDYVLRLFGKQVNSARKAYRNYVKKGLDQAGGRS